MSAGDRRVFDVKSKSSDWIFQINQRKALTSKHLVPMSFMNVYKISRVFKKKSLAYCFFHVPKYCLQDSIDKDENFLFNGRQLEQLLVSQVRRV